MVGGQPRISAVITVRCERCDALRPGGQAPAFAELTFGVPDDAGLYRTGPLEVGWWFHPIRHRPDAAPKEPGEVFLLADPAAPIGLGRCRACRTPVRMKVGTLIRKAETAHRASARSIYVP